jgi:hypothetical protein
MYLGCDENHREPHQKTRNFLVAISQPMFLAAEFALRGLLGVVHEVMHRLESAEVSEHCPQVIVRHVAKDPPQHGRIQVAGAN